MRVETVDEKTSGVVFRIKKYALHDGPGIRTTVFFKGCPLRCGWCHNPEGIDPAPQPMGPTHGQTGRNPSMIGHRATAAQVMTEIRKDLIFYDESGGGVTFSGGEPLMQPEFLTALLDLCRAEAIHTAVDTSGLAPARPFARVADRADLILFDLKIIDPLAHRERTGASNAQILENLSVAADSGTALRIRIPLIPGVTDAEENLAAIADRILGLNGVKGVDLFPFHPTADGKYRRLGMTNPMDGVQRPDERAIEKAKKAFEAFGIFVHIGG